MISLAKVYREQQCKLQKQNFTRFSSSFIMLYSVYKAYKQNLYDETNQLPFDIIEIESYIQILLPLYAFSNDLQNDMANI